MVVLLSEDAPPLSLLRIQTLLQSSSSIALASSHCSYPTSITPSPQTHPKNVTSLHVAVQAVHDPSYGPLHVPLLFPAPKSHCSPFPISVVLSPQNEPVTISIWHELEQYVQVHQ